MLQRMHNHLLAFLVNNTTEAVMWPKTLLLQTVWLELEFRNPVLIGSQLQSLEGYRTDSASIKPS